VHPHPEPDEGGHPDPGEGGHPDLGGLPGDVATLRAGLGGHGYLADDALATALFLAIRMGQPLLLEGEPGVGKTEAAKALASTLDTLLVRLQCYEGLTSAEALYEWNYPRQLLAIRLAEARGVALPEEDLFSPRYLLPRPLLAAIDHPGPRPAVLLIDEVDRADDEFEAFLFELLAEGSVTIPELGTRHARVRPVTVLTSNRTRDLHDALKRRCLYHWIRYPDQHQVADIIRRRVPAATTALADRVALTVQRLRGLDLLKPPGVAEAISWTTALTALGLSILDVRAAQATLGAVLKYEEDLTAVQDAGLAALIAPDLATLYAPRPAATIGPDGPG
jgi:MoxR-like ATPase